MADWLKMLKAGRDALDKTLKKDDFVLGEGVYGPKPAQHGPMIYRRPEQTFTPQPFSAPPKWTPAYEEKRIMEAMRPGDKAVINGRVVVTAALQDEGNETGKASKKNKAERSSTTRSTSGESHRATSSVINASHHEMIPSPGSISGEKFREVLQSHGLTITSGENDTRQIKLAAHGEYPDMYINVPFAGHNFDKNVFSEASVEQRLQYLNSILVNSGYVGEKITLDMLNSTEPLYLAPGSKAIKELEGYKENKVSGIHSDSFYFNNPEGEQERKAVRVQRVQDSMAEFEDICIQNGAKKVSSQYIHDEGVVLNALSLISLDEKDKQKLMVLDDTHRLKFLESKFKDANIQSLSPQQKELLLDSIDIKLKAEVLPSQQNIQGEVRDVLSSLANDDENISEEAQQGVHSSAAAISSANFQMEAQEEQSQSQGLKM